MSEQFFCQHCGVPTDEQLVDGRNRPVCQRCGAVTYLDPKLAVAVVIESEGNFLLGKRGEGTREAGKWSFPAGFVERGEAVEAAAIREVAEEVGLDVALGPLVGLISSEGEVVVLAVFFGRVTSGSIRPGDDLIEVAWFSLDNLPELAFPHDFQILDTWRRNQGLT